MVRRLLLLAALLSASTCSVYTPTFKDCAVHCSETGTCPTGTTCNEGFCRPDGFHGACDCSVGQSEVCGGGTGECRTGLRLCLDSRIWGPCLGEVKPTLEVCDGKDNDCDGAIDEAVSNAPSCSRTLGVCMGAVQACVDGGFVNPCPDSIFGSNYETVELTCDGLDNDCDGVADSRPSTSLASNVNAWTVESVPTGFFLFTAASGSSIVSVQEYDGALKPVGIPHTIDVGVGVASFDSHASNAGTVAVSFIRTDDSVGVLRVTTAATSPVLLDRFAVAQPQTWALSVLESGQVRAAFESDAGIALATWAPAGVNVTRAPYRTRIPMDTVSSVSLTADGTVLAWNGDYDPMDGGTSGYTGGIELLDGGRAVLNSGLGRYNLVPTAGRLQAFHTFSNYVAFFPIALDESGAIYCTDAWQPSIGCTTVARIPDHSLIRDGTAIRLQEDMVVGWVGTGTLIVGTALPTVQQVRTRDLLSIGNVADFALAATPTSTLLAVFYRSQAEPTTVYGMLLCPP